MNFRALLSATILFAAVFTPRCAAYSLYGTKWAIANVAMQLQLGAGSGVLLDGFPSWGASAEDALSLWNSHIGSSKFSVVRDSTATRAGGNGSSGRRCRLYGAGRRLALSAGAHDNANRSFREPAHRGP